MLTDGRRTTDAGVTGILIAHLGAFGSGELKKRAIVALNRSPVLVKSKSRSKIFANMLL